MNRIIIGLLCNSYNPKCAVVFFFHKSHAMEQRILWQQDTVDSQGMVVQSTLLRKFGEYECSNNQQSIIQSTRTHGFAAVAD